LCHPYTPYTYTGALAYTPTQHEPTTTKPYPTLQTHNTTPHNTTPCLPYIHTLPIQTFEILNTYPAPTCLHYPYNLHHPYNPYNTTHPMPYTAFGPCPCTHAR